MKTADGPRPLLHALGALHEKYGWTVNYEDPQYQAESSPPTNPRWRHPMLAVSGATVSVEFSTGPPRIVVPMKTPCLRPLWMPTTRGMLLRNLSRAKRTLVSCSTRLS